MTTVCVHALVCFTHLHEVHTHIVNIVVGMCDSSICFGWQPPRKCFDEWEDAGRRKHGQQDPCRGQGIIKNSPGSYHQGRVILRSLALAVQVNSAPGITASALR